jgi:hypothetical protein
MVVLRHESASSFIRSTNFATPQVIPTLIVAMTVKLTGYVVHIFLWAVVFWYHYGSSAHYRRTFCASMKPARSDYIPTFIASFVLQYDSIV